MKIIAIDRFKPGVTLETVRPYLREEVSNVWRLWKAGIVRENYARADQPGVMIVFECDSVATVRRYIDDFPLSKAGLLEWELIALDAPLPLEFLFDPSVDTDGPYDRTGAAPVGGQPGVYGPFTSPQPHLGIGAVGSIGFSDEFEFKTASRDPHSR